MTKTIAIQGIKGSFHHIVSLNYYGSTQHVKECLTFDETVASLFDNTAETAILALENSIAGSILPNYALIDNNDLHIVGEHYLDVQHQLMALPNQTIADIKEVHSHPMALLQCKSFFKDYPHIKLVEDKDTADVARKIETQQIKGVAAIASTLAAKIFNLNILAESIQTIKYNQTRFAIVKTKPINNHKNEINKASLKFELDHKRGSLASILNVMSDCKLNLTKIQSLPKIETPWKYSFFVDVTFEANEDFEKAASIMTIMATHFKILGTYKNAKL